MKAARVIATVSCLAISSALALASEPTPYPYPTPEPIAETRPAVDGVNGKLSFAGAGGDVDGYGMAGSVTAPLGNRFGFQLDGAAAEVNEQAYDDIPVYATGAHLFWRDPSRGLLGIYGDYTHVDVGNGFSFFTAAIEGALYWGRFSIDGLVGLKGGETAETGFHNQLHVTYYPTDNLSLRLGHSYSYGHHNFSLGSEWALGGSSGVTPSLFAAGLADADGHRAFVGGVKFYFGNRDKTLIQLHREADPRSYVAAESDQENNQEIILIGPTELQ